MMPKSQHSRFGEGGKGYKFFSRDLREKMRREDKEICFSRLRHSLSYKRVRMNKCTQLSKPITRHTAIHHYRKFKKIKKINNNSLDNKPNQPPLHPQQLLLLSQTNHKPTTVSQPSSGKRNTKQKSNRPTKPHQSTYQTTISPIEPPKHRLNHHKSNWNPTQLRQANPRKERAVTCLNKINNIICV